jgi:hypothetical protein
MEAHRYLLVFVANLQKAWLSHFDFAVDDDTSGKSDMQHLNVSAPSTLTCVFDARSIGHGRTMEAQSLRGIQG